MKFFFASSALHLRVQKHCLKIFGSILASGTQQYCEASLPAQASDNCPICTRSDLLSNHSRVCPFDPHLAGSKNCLDNLARRHLVYEEPVRIIHELVG